MTDETAIIEIPKHSSYKYEQHLGMELRLDRVLNQEIPFNYGYIPNTLCGDGDALDVFIISKHPIPPLTTVPFKVIGVLTCTDQGENDDKIIAILPGEESLHDVEASKWRIRNYLNTYKPGFKILGYFERDEALATIESAYEARENG